MQIDFCQCARTHRDTELGADYTQCSTATVHKHCKYVFFFFFFCCCFLSHSSVTRNGILNKRLHAALIRLEMARHSTIKNRYLTLRSFGFGFRRRRRRRRFGCARTIQSGRRVIVFGAQLRHRAVAVQAHARPAARDVLLGAQPARAQRAARRARVIVAVVHQLDGVALADGVKCATAAAGVAQLDCKETRGCVCVHVNRR